ncbi:MAG: SHOCT domain-containing protein [Bacillota bacterium]|nr:SHOCT domain-containing protein [Bacillota bacterium]
MGGYVFWLLLLAILWFLFGGCGRGFFWRGGCGPRWYGPEPRPEQPVETPKQILDRRLAKGEITLEEYRRLLQELSEGK